MNRLLLWLLAVGLFAFVSCKKDETWTGRPDRGVFQMRIIHAAPATAPVNVESQYYNTRNRWASDFQYNATFPDYGYVEMEGIDQPNEFRYNIDSLIAYTTDSLHKDSTMIDFLPALNKKYSLFVIDSTDLRFAPFRYEKDFAWLILEDNYTKQTDTTVANVRFVNLAHRKEVFLNSPTNNTNTASVKFKNNTGYYTVKNGVYDFKAFETTGQEGAAISGVKLEAKKSYTIYYDGVNLHYYRHD